MTRTIIVVAIAGLATLLHVSEARAGAGQGGDQSTGKISGPAVSATVVINPTFVSPTKGQTTVRLSKGVANSSALFQHEQAAAQATNWFAGCDGFHGADPERAVAPADADADLLTTERFVNSNNRIRSWMPDDVMRALFGQLGIPFDGFLDETGPTPLPLDDGKRIPVITDVTNVMCTRVPLSAEPQPPTGDWFLSFIAVIQFEDSTK